MVGATRSAPTSRTQHALLGAVGLLLAGLVFRGGGPTDANLAILGGLTIALATIGLALGLRGRLAIPRPETAGLVVLGGSALLTVWAGASIGWSIAGDASWVWLNRGLVYVAVLVLGGLVARRVDALAVLLAVVLGTALGWALLGVAVPAWFADGDRIARLREPVGYWNGLALLADAAVVLGLWAALARARWSRGLGGGLVFVAVLVVLLTQSRSGVVAGAIVVAVWLALSSRRLESALVLVCAGVPAAIVGGWAFTRTALVEDEAGRTARVDAAPWFVVLCLVGLTAALALCALVPFEALALTRRRAVTRLLVIAGCVVALVGLVGLVAKVGEPVSWARDQVSGGECTNDPGRLTALCANNRLAWWGESLDIARAHPIGGTGAGTFRIARLRVRDDATPTTEPHSVPFQLLADTGVVGLLLGLGVFVAAVVGIRRSICRARDQERDTIIALTALPLAFALHALVDYDLDFLALAGPAVLVLGALLGAGRPPLAVRRAGVGSALAITASALAAFALLALPELAQRDIRSASEDTYAGRLGAAERLADRARRLDPLTLGPLYALADVADRRGSHATAVGWYRRATRLQPQNPEPWVALGRYHFIVTGNLCAAYEAFNQAYTLDPRSSRWVEGGPLDVARDAVNDGACGR